MGLDERLTDIHRFLAKELSAEELADFHAWRAEDPAHEQLVRECEEVWESAGQYQVPTFDSAPAWKQLGLPDRQITRGAIWLRRAAAVTILVIAGWLAYSYVLTPVEWMSSDKSELALEDGSQIFLSDGSTLSYPKSFDRRDRTVRLDGVAFFEVAEEADRPFVVETDWADVVVLGTAFGVEEDLQARSVVVRVTEGKVRLQPRGSDLYLDIEAGQAASFADQTGELKQLRDADLNALAWHTRTLSFRQKSMTEVIEDLSDAFGVKIDLSQSGISDCTYTSPQPFKNASIDQILDAMAIVFQMRVTSPEDGVYLLIGGTCD